MLQKTAKVSITLPELPYVENALEPVISARTILRVDDRDRVQNVRA
jgi:hypothetical protein